MSRMHRNQMTLELWRLDSSINLENPRVSFRSRRIVDFIEKLGVTIGSTVGLRSTVEMTHRLIKMVRISHVCPIGDEASGCIHVTHVKRRFDLIHPLDLNPTIAISRCVHRSRLISTLIIPLMDGCD